jgi:thymidylate synthase ThyX
MMEFPNWAANVVADSRNLKADRITTFLLTYPRFIHAELMTHRQFARNAASSRAIPIERMIEAVEANPAAPIHWGQNQAGMQAFEQVNEDKRQMARDEWLEARSKAVYQARRMVQLGIHKQIANRILEPFSWITTIVTATEWNNFFHQRYSPFAQPEFLALARQMALAYEQSVPTLISPVSAQFWHLPLIDMDARADVSDIEAILCGGEGERMSGGEEGWEQVDWWLKRISVARCARVSYLNHNAGKTIADDIRLFNRLKEGGHWSPFEHVAKPISGKSGCFTGWKPFRKDFLNENRTDKFSAWEAEQDLIEQGWEIEVLQKPFEK